MRLPQEHFGSHMIFILAVTALLFSIIMNDAVDAVDAVRTDNFLGFRHVPNA